MGLQLRQHVGGRSRAPSSDQSSTAPPSTRAKGSGNAADGQEAGKHARRHPLFFADTPLYLHSECPDPARVLEEHQHVRAHKPRPVFTEPDPGPELYGTGLDAGEGLWLGAGWAGRG